jgi:prepilin-type N-terminal cleavage/methylation domain-containing protein
MKTALHRNRLGFTLVELMIVVTIISIVASIAIPAYSRSRKRAQATRTLEDLRLLEYALDRWAIEQNKSVGDVASLSDLVPYLKNGSLLAGGVDVLGNSYGDAFSVDSIPKVNDLTFDSLSDVAPAAFWSPYK